MWWQDCREGASVLQNKVSAKCIDNLFRRSRIDRSRKVTHLMESLRCQSPARQLRVSGKESDREFDAAKSIHRGNQESSVRTNPSSQGFRDRRQVRLVRQAKACVGTIKC